jgi:hypothetical protein
VDNGGKGEEEEDGGEEVSRHLDVGSARVDANGLLDAV